MSGNVCIIIYDFDWDEKKEKLNVKNHDGIDFDEASRSVQDDFALEEYDDVHSTADEKRYKCIGESCEQNFVCRLHRAKCR